MEAAESAAVPGCADKRTGFLNRRGEPQRHERGERRDDEKEVEGIWPRPSATNQGRQQSIFT